MLGIDSPVISPTDNETEFKNTVALSCVAPTSSHAGKFVVLLEPLADGRMGKAYTASLRRHATGVGRLIE